jgi:hypothetical protein
VDESPVVKEMRPMARLCLLGLSGSLRGASNSTVGASPPSRRAFAKAALDFFAPAWLPLYNEDDDGEQGRHCRLPERDF